MKMDGLYLAVSMNFGWFPLRRLYYFRGYNRPPLMPGVIAFVENDELSNL
jgi:hypothetical protein